jgi:hypothetical protein
MSMFILLKMYVMIYVILYGNDGMTLI